MLLVLDRKCKYYKVDISFSQLGYYNKNFDKKISMWEMSGANVLYVYKNSAAIGGT